MKKILKIGARGSPLSLAQTNQVAAALKACQPGLETEITVIKTTGDIILDRPLAQIGGKGLFVKEIEEALLDKRIDLAVHSAKDMPNELPPGLFIASIPERADARDALISPQGWSLDELPSGAVVGTSSLRRSAQLLNRRPDLQIQAVRGNVQTRLNKLKEDCQAVLLAAAGLDRLGLQPEGLRYLNPDIMLPAVGQGALALEARTGDEPTLALIRRIHHETTALTLKAERAFLKTVGGNCRAPVAAWAQFKGPQEIHLQGLIAEPDGSRVFQGFRTMSLTEVEAKAQELATELLGAGGAAIIARLVEAN